MVQKGRTMVRNLGLRWGRSLFMLVVWGSVSAAAFAWREPPVLRFADDENAPVAEPDQQDQDVATPVVERVTLPEQPQPTLERSSREPPELSADLPNINASSLRGVTPGITSMAKLRELWGKSQKTVQQNGVERLFYEIEPFAGVKVEIVDDRVVAIHIKLAALAAPESLTKELDLEPFRSFDLPNKRGVLVGKVFPERGVTYIYTDAKKDQPLRVSHISLEPTTADFFVLRVIYDTSHSYQNNLSDLDHAQQLDPEDARVYWLKAKIQHAIGQQSRALVNAREAVRREPQAVSLRLTLAKILISKAAEAEARKVLLAIVEQNDIPADLLAGAHVLLGAIDAQGMQPDFEASTDHFMEAVRLAKTVKNSSNQEVFRNAQMALLEANLGAAYSICAGNWRGKREMAPRWIHQGKRAARDIVENKQGDIASLSFLVLEKSLEAYAAANGEFDPAQEAEAVLREGERIVAAAKDPLYKKELQWRFAQALFYAVEAQHIRGRHEAVKVLGEKALKLLLEASDSRSADPRNDYLFGRLYFYVGAALAIGDEDHQAASLWYARAIEFLQQTPPPAHFRHVERHGERFVSMGLTYWEIGEQTEGVELTQAGLRLMQQAVEQEKVGRGALFVPLDNLSKMHQTLGKTEEAKKYARQAESITTAAKTPTRR